MVCAEKIVIRSKLIWKRKAFGFKTSAKVRKVNYEGYYVPFWENFKNLISNPEIYDSFVNQTSNSDNIYRTVLDGCFNKNHEFFKNHKNALAIIFYYDDLVVGNPLGVAAKKHKLSMFYWTLANIKPEVRSSLNIIQLYAIVRTEHLKQPNGVAKILQPFITDIVKLQTVGINIHVNGELKNLKGPVIFCAGDTPASAMLGGFKESVAAYRLCRTCMITKDEWRQNFSTQNFILRNKTDHQEHVDVVSDSSVTNAAQEFWKTQYGINKQSSLADIPFFDATKCFPQDAMHVLIEGVGEIVCRAFLRYCIVVEKIFTLDQLNENIEKFYFKYFQNDKPALILSSHLTEEGHLRQSAAQFLVLFYTLPFLIGEWIVENNENELEEQISCYMQMLDIIKVSLAYEIHEDTVDYLDQMIRVFIINFNRLYLNLIVPKFHFMMHIPYYIKLFGPARQLWCFNLKLLTLILKHLLLLFEVLKTWQLRCHIVINQDYVQDFVLHQECQQKNFCIKMTM
ncbi:uncharacterized protein LOC141533888 [Cotesia typhae]|uniref:uncharacterized protein LOC141533888 n=1 Tax=Cotesia typhae TaxID=2053667 RepID=UPI003D699A06